MMSAHSNEPVGKSSQFNWGVKKKKAGDEAKKKKRIKKESSGRDS